MNEKTNEFIRKAKEKHGDTYDYSKVEYTGCFNEVKIICKIHGEFLQTAHNHLCKKGCIECGKEKVKNSKKYDVDSLINRFVEKHGNFYDYSLVTDKNYINMHSPLPIICPIHGEFYQPAMTHLVSKCYQCGRNAASTNKRICFTDFVAASNKIHSNKYSYCDDGYQGVCKNKIKIICEKHGVFYQSPILHMHGCGCPGCKKSLGEMNVEGYLKTKHIEYFQNKSFEGCYYKNKLLFDFYLPKYNITIEFDGLQHFQPVKHFGGCEGFRVTKARDTIKNTFCVNNNIGLIRIRYDEIDKIEEILTACITHGIRYRGLPIETCQSVANI